MKKLSPSSAVVSLISPGFGRGFFSFGAFFFFFFLLLGDIIMFGVVVEVATATDVDCAISDSFLILSAEYLRK